MTKPLALALGDPAGIGPEIAAKAWERRRQEGLAPFFAVGLPDALAAVWDGPIREIKAGDVVFFAPGEKHWHGAGPKTAMTHLAMHEALDGVHVEWLEKVSDEQYAG